MKSLMRYGAYIVLFFAGTTGFALKGKNVTLSGTVKSYDLKIVKVESVNTVWNVPRSKIMKKNLVAGENIEVSLPLNELDSLKHTTAQSK